MADSEIVLDDAAVQIQEETADEELMEDPSTHRWDKVAEDVGNFDLLGIVKVTIDNDDYASTEDTLDAIRHLRKSWRSAKSWRHGFDKQVQLKYQDVNQNGQPDLVMKFKSASTHKTKSFATTLNNVSCIVSEHKDLAFLQVNRGHNALESEKLSEPDGYVCYILETNSEEEAKHFEEDLAHLVTEEAVASAKEKFSRSGAATFSGRDSHIYGFETDPNGGMVDKRQRWYRGALKRGESEKLRSGPEVKKGDFYVRESSKANNYTLTVVVDPSDGSVAHFRIKAVNVGKPSEYCFLEGHEDHTFANLKELICYYDSKGLGKVHGQKVQLIRALGTDGKFSAMEEKLAKMNDNLKRGFDF